ncbi:four-carbon acid sugar kinase family protein [Falsiroseomonas sp. CW058]|uniref:four-carbon acid sugar kinase family protein n=1 Tax=Falsiroseomonas sp. CW058 TaxID=3388664 RepID=UPI003D3141B5
MRLRLLADDLTGALDSAAEFTAACGPVEVRWDGRVPAGSFALDAGTRERPESEAAARMAALAPALAGEGTAFRKIDSLLRGHVAAELGACLASRAWARCVVAPAFPAQGRVTRGGVQWVRDAGGALVPAGDLRAALGALPGVTIHDAETEDDLARIVAEARCLPGPVLWCGTGGLAGALAGAAVRPDLHLAGPVLGLFGSDNPATARQLAACDDLVLRIADGGAGDAARVARRLAGDGVAMVAPALPAGLPRTEAAARIAEAFAALTARLPPPATLLVAGGETLRMLCAALGASALRATGLVLRGVPRSLLVGGRWDGTLVISKSGAFGADALWRDLLASNGLAKEPTPA